MPDTMVCVGHWKLCLCQDRQDRLQSHNWLLQALVRERMEDWGNGLCRVLDKKLVELTGDITPDIRCGTDAPHLVSQAPAEKGMRVHRDCLGLQTDA